MVSPLVLKLVPLSSILLNSTLDLVLTALRVWCSARHVGRLQGQDNACFYSVPDQSTKHQVHSAYKGALAEGAHSTVILWKDSVFFSKVHPVLQQQLRPLGFAVLQSAQL